MRILFDIAEVSRLGDIFSDETTESHEYEVSDGDKARKWGKGRLASLEDLGAATCKLVNFVDHKVQSPLEVLQKSSTVVASVTDTLTFGLLGLLSKFMKGFHVVVVHVKDSILAWSKHYET